MNKPITFAILASALVLPALAGTINSGLSVGESVSPFHPTHVTGPDAGTDTCPPCKYQARPAVQVWVNGDDLGNVQKIAKVLNDSTKSYKKNEFKGFVIFLVSADKKAAMDATIKKVAGTTGFTNIGMATLAKNNEAVSNYKVNVDKSVKNTVFVYKNWKVESKFINLKADSKGVGQLEAAIEKIAG